MAKQQRVTSHGTFFITAPTYARRRVFQTDQNAQLFLDTLQHYRREGLYKLYAFVVMPDHVHLILTPQTITLERAMQHIKGGFSHRLASPHPIWQRGFADHRIHDRDDFLTHMAYVHDNPVRARLCQHPEDFRWPPPTNPPQRVKPPPFLTPPGTAEAVPFRSSGAPHVASEMWCADTQRYTPTMTITLDEATEQLLQRELQRGEFADANELIAHALRRLQSEDATPSPDEMEAWLLRNKEAINAALEESFAAEARGESYSPEELRAMLDENRSRRRSQAA